APADDVNGVEGKEDKGVHASVSNDHLSTVDGQLGNGGNNFNDRNNGNEERNGNSGNNGRGRGGRRAYWKRGRNGGGYGRGAHANSGLDTSNRGPNETNREH